MICPKCGRPVEEAAVICPGCDFILDTNFLGGDILDEEHQLRPGQGGVDPAVFNLADAVILGNIGDDTSSFETSDSGFHIKKDMQAARLYVSGRSQAVMSPDAVIAAIDDVTGVRLTPFEKHVLRFIDGKRPVEAIRRQAGLDEAEVKTALANLADKGVVKVVGRALSDVADFDSETAPGNAPRSKPRRMRGTLVGAVVVVGDAADQAIDDAFRTQVRAVPKLNDLRDDIAGDDDVDVDGDVFSEDGSHDSAEDSDSDISAVPPPVDDDDDDELFEAGTAEVPVRGGRLPTSSTSTVRPAGMRDAVNAGRGRTSRIANNALSDVDASDGFDDFGDVSELATAVVAAPSLSEDSSLPGADVLSPVRGAFADPALSPVGLSDLEDFDDPGVDDLADSRVEPRPILPPLPRAAPPAMPSLLGGVVLPGSAEESLNDEELAAFSGGVWDDDVMPPRRHVVAERLSAEDDGSDDDSDLPDPAEEPTNVRPPQTRPATSARSVLSTSLSALLDSADDESIPGPTAPQVPSAKQSKPQHQRPRVLDSAEENTAFRPPPSPMAAPLARSSLFIGSSGARRPATPAEMQTPSSLEESTVQGRFSVANGVPAAVVSPTPSPSMVAPPGPTSALERVGAADDLFPDDDDGDDDDERSQETLPPRPGSAWSRPSPPAPSPPASQHAAADDEDPNKTGWYEPGVVSARSQDVDGFGLLATEQVPPLQRAAAASPRSPAMDPTLPPSVEAAGNDSSAWSDSGMAQRRPQPPPPEPSRFDGRLPAPSSLNPPVPTNVGFVDSSSVEVLDSAMVIRPAIKAVPLALAVKRARGAAVVPPQTPPPIAGDDDDEFMVDPDATMNLPPLPRSQEGEARKRRAPSLAEGSGPVSIAEPAAKETGNRRAPTEDMRRKARNLMEQAQQDHSVGRLGAARMNAKLATIYDPDNAAYKRVLADWEERPKAGGGGSGLNSAINSRPEYVQLYESAQDLEDDDDIDGALAMLEKGLRLAPNAAAFHNRIGVILAMRKRDFERASDEIKKAIALEPDNPHYRNNLGKVMAKANKRRSPATGTDGR